MLTADHPNALWLTELYGGSAAITNDASLDEDERERRLTEHQQTVMQRVSPKLVVHTGGIRLAATGDLAFMQAYGRRRAQIGGTNTPLELYLILADDHFGINYQRTRSARGDHVWERPGMGAWRFEDGLAVEHWEIGHGQNWDAFYLAVDPDLDDPREYWTRGT